MKKLLIFLVVSFIATSCYAATDVYIRNGSDDSIISFPSLTSSTLPTSSRIWNGTDYVGVQDNRLNVNTNQLLIGSFTSYASNNVSTSSFVQLGTGYVYDLSLRTSATNNVCILVGPSTATEYNAYPMATNTVLHFDLVNLSQLYVKAGVDGSGTNSLYWVGYQQP